MLLGVVNLANPQVLYPWIAALVRIRTLIFSFIHGTLYLCYTEEEEWDNMEAVKIKYAPFEQEYTFKDVISK